MSRIVVYSKSGCPFCSLLKMELTKRGHVFDAIDLSDDDLRMSFYELAGVRTVPQLYLADEDHSLTHLSGVRVGGWTEVSADWSALIM
jgi:glutaredoxin 3